jgi:hypothetical protein
MEYQKLSNCTRIGQNRGSIKKGLTADGRKPLILLVPRHRIELWTRGFSVPILGFPIGSHNCIFHLTYQAVKSKIPSYNIP